MQPKVTKNFRQASMAKQLPFAAAKTLTTTAKGAQTEVLSKLGRKFTLRNNWFRPNTPLGIKVKPAKKTNLAAEVGTNFDALEKFETGKDKTPRGAHLAIPTGNVRRNKRQIIQRSQRPGALRGKRTFVIPTRSGPVLFQRKYKGKRSRVIALYNLETRARIRKNSPVIEPALKSIRANLNKNFLESLDQAMKSAR
jgi:hypothetical protein